MMINDNYSNYLSTNSFITEQKKIKNDILYALISIYYYEKTLSLNNNKEIIFMENQAYYFINPNWIITFKKIYNYQILSQILNSIKIKNITITYYNFENNISSIKNYLSQNNFSVENNEIPQTLMNNIFASQRKFNNFIYYPYCYIINMKIKKIFQNYVFKGNKLNVISHKVLAKNNSVYLNDANNIIISGNLNKNFIYMSEYVLFFISPEILSNEKSLLLKFSSFSDYLKYKHIENISSNKLPLKDENNNIIGEIILIPKNQTNNENQKSNPSSNKKSIMVNNSIDKFKKINSANGSNIIFNNSKGNNKNIQKVRKINILNKNITERHISLTDNSSSKKKYFNKQSQSIGPKNNISSNNLEHSQKIQEFVLYDKLVNKDNNCTNEDEDEISKVNKGVQDYDKLRKDFLTKINAQKISFKKVDNQPNNKYDNDMKDKKDGLIQEFEEKEKEVQNLRKLNSNLQMKIKKLESNYINKFNTLQKELENKNKEIKNLCEKISTLEALNRKGERELNQNNKENELNIRNNELNGKENKLNEREKIISIKENVVNVRNKELIEKENNINKREIYFLKKEKEINIKEEELNKRNNELILKENNINEREKRISYKEKEINNNENTLKRKNNELFVKENNINEKEKAFLNKENEYNKKQSEMIYKINELNEKEKNIYQKEIEFNKKEKDINERENIISLKEKEINNKENELTRKENNRNKENTIFSKEEDLNKKKKELIEKEKNINEREKIILEKEKEIKSKENELKLKSEELNKKEKDLNDREKNIIKPHDDSINPMPLPPLEPDPISLYKKPTLIGLNNCGATCFMNSTLQCLSQTPDFTRYFLKGSKKGRIINNNLAKENKDSLQLSPIYLKLIQKLWDKNGGKSFSPNEFMNIIEKMNPLFKKGQAGDSKDFIIYILEQIHKELKSPINTNYNVDQPLNQYDRNNAFNHFLKDFSSECSIISDSFFGFNETTNECLNCKNYYNSQYTNNPICYNFGIFNCLIFPLEEVKNYKNNLMKQSFMNNMNYINNMNYMNNNSVTLDDCFLYNQKTDLFTGENRNYCNICKQLYDSYYTSKIYSSPNNLILILNRGRNNIYNVKLFFNETIDITQYVVLNNGNKWIYNLYGVITHIGQSGPNAHFVASCKSPVNNNWYRYNDAIVNPINDIQKEVINFGTPYILFYQKQNNNM